jgi:broad specificity phosphatase PhoE
LYNLGIKIPYHIWAWLNHIAWFRNHISHPEGREITVRRLNEIMSVIMKQKNKNILVVSHAGTMFELQNILKKAGFVGKTFIKAKNGRLYIFEKKD